jgi:hypothetical protein
MNRLTALFTGFWLLGLAGCSLPVDPAPASSENLNSLPIAGTVTFMDLEGGTWVIHGDDGSVYEPLNLPDSYRQQGLRISAEVILRKDVASIFMTGPVIELLHIRMR